MSSAATWTASGCLAALLIAVALAHNRLLRRRQRVERAWAQIDVQLARRHDLVPGLVAAVRAQFDHERTSLERLAGARTSAQAARTAHLTPPERAVPEALLSQALGALCQLVEGRPELRSSDAVRRLMEDLVSTENRIAFARQHYNDAVLAYRDACGRFPTTLVARAFRFRSAGFLDLPLSSARRGE